MHPYAWALDWDTLAAIAALAAARRAPHVLRHGRPDVVAGRARRLLGRRQGRVPLRRVRARITARAPARVAPPSGLRLLQARPATVGALRSDRPTDRRRLDGGRAGDRLLRRVRALLCAFPAH